LKSNEKGNVMKIKKLVIENVKSFKERTEINFSDNLNIFVGPNAGGKSNLLDIVTITLRNFFIRFYRINKNQEMGRSIEDVVHQQVFQPINNFLEKNIGNELNMSTIELTFTTTREDIENIISLKNRNTELEDKLRKYRNKPINDFNFINSLQPEHLSESHEFTYRIRDNTLESATDILANAFFQYLLYYELFNLIGQNIEDFRLNPLLLYFSPHRIVNQSELITNLSGTNFQDLLSGYIQSTSRGTDNIINIATHYFVEKLRKYEHRGGDYYENFKQDDEVKFLTRYLNKMNFNWEIKCVDVNKNIYELNLMRNGKQFSIVQASSGEKEILNFLLGMFALNIRNGLVVIDEPELHLHPKWQTILVTLLQELSTLNHNQFLIVTHSPVFINERTIENVFRIYRNGETSKVVQPERNSLPKVKDLLHIVNTFNNEKIFFADKVVLVEGIGDRLIFQKLIEKYQNSDQEIIEILEVHGKHNLAKYRDFLNLFNIKNYLIADLDYALNVGLENIKSMFTIDYSKIDENVLLQKKSKDGNYLAKLLKEVIDNIEKLDNEKIKDLKSIWEHIESRYKKLKDDLSEVDKCSLNEFIKSKKLEGIYILKHGEIEDYFPQLSKNRGVESIIEFTTDEKFNEWFQDTKDDNKKRELISIICKILDINENNVSTDDKAYYKLRVNQ